MPHPNIHKYLDLSTGHITKETCNNPPYKVADYEYGAMLYVPDEVHSQCPEDLAKVIEYAKKHDCAMILFDRDAGTCEDLPIYDWSPPEQSEADKLRNIKESLLLAIAHRFLREYDSEMHEDPRGPEGDAPRVVRGGSWSDGARRLRSAYRSGGHRGDRDGAQGFRFSLRSTSQAANAERSPGGALLTREA